MTLAINPGNSPDFDYVNGGSVILMIPLTSDARRWTRTHIASDTPTLGQGFAVEPRYFLDLVQEIEDAGMMVRS